MMKTEEYYNQQACYTASPCSTSNRYLPDGTLLSRNFRTKRIDTHIKVDQNGDTIVKNTRRDYVTSHLYMGSFERVNGLESYYRVHTPAGYWDSRIQYHHWYLTDRLGSTVAVIEETGKLLQRNGYFPSGTPYLLPSDDTPIPLGGQAPTLTNATDRLHIGNRYLSHIGLNWYDNTDRMHDPLLMRFTSPDPLASKYPALSPWAHTAANPVNAIDPSGDSIIVANTYQPMVNESLSVVFGNKAKDFSYTSSGMLVFNGTTKGMKGNQKAILKGLSKLMSSSVNTVVHIGKEMTIKDMNGNEITKYASEGGGALSMNITDNPNLTDNHILIDKNLSSIMVEEMIDPNSPLAANYNIAYIETNFTDLFFHEIGHIIYQKDYYSSAKALIYNNKVRKLIGLPLRKFDRTHNELPNQQ